MPPQLALIERARLAREKSEHARDLTARSWFATVAKRYERAASMVIKADHLEMRADQRERPPGGGPNTDLAL